MSVWTLQRVLLRRLFRYAFEMGLKRTSTLSDKIINEECDEWIEKNIVNKE